MSTTTNLNSSCKFYIQSKKFEFINKILNMFNLRKTINFLSLMNIHLLEYSLRYSETSINIIKIILSAQILVYETCCMSGNNSVEQNDSIFRYDPASTQNSFISCEDSTQNTKVMKSDNVMIDIAFVKDYKTIKLNKRFERFLVK